MLKMSKQGIDSMIARYHAAVGSTTDTKNKWKASTKTPTGTLGSEKKILDSLVKSKHLGFNPKKLIYFNGPKWSTLPYRTPEEERERDLKIEKMLAEGEKHAKKKNKVVRRRR